MSFTCSGMEIGETLPNVWNFTASPLSAAKGQHLSKVHMPEMWVENCTFLHSFHFKYIWKWAWKMTDRTFLYVRKISTWGLWSLKGKCRLGSRRENSWSENWIESFMNRNTKSSVQNKTQHKCWRWSVWVSSLFFGLRLCTTTWFVLGGFCFCTFCCMLLKGACETMGHFYFFLCVCFISNTRIHCTCNGLWLPCYNFVSTYNKQAYFWMQSSMNIISGRSRKCQMCLITRWIRNHK